MLLGEYEFTTTMEDYLSTVSDLEVVLCCLLLVGLALVGTLVLVNLLLALIVSDVDNLYKTRCREGGTCEKQGFATSPAEKKNPGKRQPIPKFFTRC